MRSPAPLRIVALLAAALSIWVGQPCQAKNWQFVDIDNKSGSRVYLDQDSISQIGNLKTYQILVIFNDVQTSNSAISYDKKINTIGIDCQNYKSVLIRTVGYLGDKAVGATPTTEDWKNKMLPTAGATAARLISRVCGAAAVGSGAPSTVVAPPTGPPSGGPPPSNTVKIFSGSGIFVNDDGYLLTNVHVVNGCKTIVAKVIGASPVPASIDAVDPKDDLAILRTQPRYGTPVRFRAESEPVRLGENVAVIGYPLMGILSSEPKATFGQVNSVAGMNNDYTLLQISAPVQPGNSGGPVFDNSGLIVGVVVSQASAKLVEITGSVPQNINFAIRGEIAQILMTAHGVSFKTGDPGWRLDTDAIAARGEKSTAQILCIKAGG